MKIILISLMMCAFLKNKIINCGWCFKFWDKANIFKIYLIYPDFKYWRQLFFLEKSFVKKEEKCFKILFESCIKCIVLCIFLSHNRPPLHDEILPIWRKTLSNQSINQSITQQKYHYGFPRRELWPDAKQRTMFHVEGNRNKDIMNTVPKYWIPKMEILKIFCLRSFDHKK